MFSNLKEAGMKWASSPQAMKLMTNPNVQKALMKALQLPGEVRNAVQERTKAFAEYADLATRGDIQTFQRTMRDLEREIGRLKRDLDAERAKVATMSTAAAAPTAAPPAETEAPKKTKIAIKKKSDA